MWRTEPIRDWFSKRKLLVFRSWCFYLSPLTMGSARIGNIKKSAFEQFQNGCAQIDSCGVTSVRVVWKFSHFQRLMRNFLLFNKVFRAFRGEYSTDWMWCIGHHSCSNSQHKEWTQGASTLRITTYFDGAFVKFEQGEEWFVLHNRWKESHI